jgi:hypothetical protein
LKVSQNILPCQHRTDVAGEACHRSRQRDFHRLDGAALQHLHHFQLEATSIALTEAAGRVSGSGCNTNPQTRSGASAKWK